MRLACVKHSASVRSEPGSNSQVHTPASQPAYKSQRQTLAPIQTQRSPAIPTAYPRITSKHASSKTRFQNLIRISMNNPSKRTRRETASQPQAFLPRKPERLVSDVNHFFSGAAILASPPFLVKPRHRRGERLLRPTRRPVNSRFELSAGESRTFRPPLSLSYPR